MPPKSKPDRQTTGQIPSSAESETAKRIVLAARRHFMAHGFRGVTMDDVASELGMSKKTLYSCFASKTALLEAVLRDKLREVETELDELAAADGSDFPATLQQLLACMQRHTEEIQPPFVRDIRREAPEMFRLVECGRRGLIERHFTRLFEQGRKAGLVRKDVSVKLIIEILLAATDAIVNPVRIEEFGLTPKTGYSAIVSVVLTGVLNDRGRMTL